MDRQQLRIGTRTSPQLLSAQQALLPKPHLEAGIRLDVLLTCRDDALRQLALLLATNEASVVDLAPDVVAELVQLGNHRIEAYHTYLVKCDNTMTPGLPPPQGGTPGPWAGG
eukprot:COSAG02_NODE_8075_length_2720_cov_2.186952_1_plen_112_part_00